MVRKTYGFRPRNKVLELGASTRIMGVVNVTPDSFFEGGKYGDRSQAVERCLEWAAKGAHIIDLGGESSRPGAQPLSSQEELDRVLPVLEEIRGRVSALISVDTYKSSVARRVLQAGADIINDISAFRLDPRMPGVITEWGAGVVLMHMRGTPQDMQQLPPSPDILAEIESDLQRALDTASEHRIPRDRIVLDPGIGFGKTFEDNLKILNQLSFLSVFQLPILVGTSRKSFLGKILDLPVERRLLGTAASVAVAIVKGAHLVRVHDVEEMLQVVKVTDTILAEEGLQ